MKILSDIRKRPEIYLGERSLKLLYAFLCGIICYRNFDRPEDDYYDMLPGFYKFLAKKYNVIETVGIVRIISKESIDDRDAFNNFFILLDEFMQK